LAFSPPLEASSASSRPAERDDDSEVSAELSPESALTLTLAFGLCVVLAGVLVVELVLPVDASATASALELDSSSPSCASDGLASTIGESHRKLTMRSVIIVAHRSHLVVNFIWLNLSKPAPDLVEQSSIHLPPSLQNCLLSGLKNLIFVDRRYSVTALRSSESTDQQIQLMLSFKLPFGK